MFRFLYRAHLNGYGRLKRLTSDYELLLRTQSHFKTRGITEVRSVIRVDILLQNK